MILSTLILAATLSPSGIVAWLIIGLVAGTITHWLIPSKGFGDLGNLVITRKMVLISLVIATLGCLSLTGCGTEKQPGHFAQSVGVLKTTNNETLHSNINTFMETHKSEYDLGKDNYHCGNILYGYDDKYAYAWVYCSGFLVKHNNELEPGTGFSVATRLEYKFPDFQIINFKQPSDSGSAPTLDQLFPRDCYALANNGKGPSNAELEKLDQEVRNKAKRS